MPGHILLPPPNGMYSKLLPLKSIELSINLSGIKFSGSIQYFGSLPIAQAFTITLVFLDLSLMLSKIGRLFQSRNLKAGNTSANSKPPAASIASSTIEMNSS
ncbi:hypothetical protein G4B88_003641 [Cannabis sativa]|nr:hypothetical protein G4B88_003641 [Cannabis sativa]